MELQVETIDEAGERLVVSHLVCHRHHEERARAAWDAFHDSAAMPRVIGVRSTLFWNAGQNGDCPDCLVEAAAP